MKACCESFGPTFVTSGDVFGIKPVQIEDVTAFIEQVGPELLIAVTGHGEGVNVWYWEQEKGVSHGRGN